MERKYLSSGYQMQEFVGSSVWADMQLALDEWLESVRDKLESENDALEIRRYQGIAEALRNVSHLPETIASNMMLIEEDDSGNEC